MVPNSNVVEEFGSWEDFYVVRDLIFQHDDDVSVKLEELYSIYGHRKSELAYAGKNFNKFMIWVDEEILLLSKEIGNYGYEVRTDADVYKKDGKIYKL